MTNFQVDNLWAQISLVFYKWFLKEIFLKDSFIIFLQILSFFNFFFNFKIYYFNFLFQFEIFFHIEICFFQLDIWFSNFKFPFSALNLHFSCWYLFKCTLWFWLFYSFRSIVNLTFSLKLIKMVLGSESNEMKW